MNLHKKFIIAIIIFLSFLFFGTLIYSSIEGWRYIDSAYFTVATVTTIGYGDVVPQTDFGKIFTIFFSFFGIGMAFYFFTLFGKYLYKKTFQIDLEKHHKELVKHHKKLITHLKSKGNKNPPIKRK